MWVMVEPGGDGQSLDLLHRPFTDVSSYSCFSLRLPVLSDVMALTDNLSL